MTRQEKIRDILIVKPSSLGDILHVFPVLELIRRNFPEANVDFLINTEFAPLLDFSPVEIRHRILFERKKLGSIKNFPGTFLKLCKSLRQEQYDVVIDFQGLFRSAFFASLTRNRNGICGFADTRESAAKLFYARKYQTHSVHAVEKNVELFNRIFDRNEAVPECTIPHQAPGFAEKLPEHYVVLIPGARWVSKCFPAELFAEIANKLHQKDPTLQFATAGSPAEQAMAEAVKAALAPGVQVTDFTGKTTLQELFELLRHADCAVCNDSGPMHIAALLNTPVFSFFGPTFPEKTGPWHQEDRIQRSDAACMGCMNRVCPLAEQLCHKIDPEKTASCIGKFLQERKSSLC